MASEQHGHGVDTCRERMDGRAGGDEIARDDQGRSILVNTERWPYARAMTLREFRGLPVLAQESLTGTGREADNGRAMIERQKARLDEFFAEFGDDEQFADMAAAWRQQAG